MSRRRGIRRAERVYLDVVDCEMRRTATGHRVVGRELVVARPLLIRTQGVDRTPRLAAPVSVEDAGEFVGGGTRRAVSSWIFASASGCATP